MTRLIDALTDISADYDALFVDLWGCVHDGLRALPDAVAALQTYRRGGGVVILVTNSPRPRRSVQEQILGFGVPEDAWDSIATSGDSARKALFEGVVGQNVWHVGEAADIPFFEPLSIQHHPIEIRRVPLEEAEGIVCTDPFDARADPEVMAPEFEKAIARRLKLLCANPDIVVDRGEQREWCAGALAHLYSRMGGESLYFGKPHAPIYDLARKRLDDIRPGIDDARILAIGDGIHTDIDGAAGRGIDGLFITGGLAARETQTDRQPDETALKAYLLKEDASPEFAIGHLR